MQQPYIICGREDLGLETLTVSVCLSVRVCVCACVLGGGGGSEEDYSPFIKRWALALASSRIWRFFVISSYTVQCCEI